MIERYYKVHNEWIEVSKPMQVKFTRWGISYYATHRGYGYFKVSGHEYRKPLQS